MRLPANKYYCWKHKYLYLALNPGIHLVLTDQ